jgi:hypothetical protein
MLDQFSKIVKEKWRGKYWIYILLRLLVEVIMKTGNMRQTGPYIFSIRHEKPCFILFKQRKED